MKINSQTSYPKMSWYAKIDGNNMISEVNHGSNVRASNNLLFEGTYRGDYSSAGLIESDVVAGSGFVIINGNLTFITPSHTLEGVFVVKNNDDFFVTNSNVLAYGLSEIIPTHHALKIGWRIRYGLNQIPQLIEQTKDSWIQKISYHNFSIENGQITIVEKTKSPLFDGFESYSNYLKSTTKSMASNMRKNHDDNWKLMGTVSTGFDSVACLSIISQQDCKEALTLVNGRGNCDDDGSLIASALKIKCHKFTRPFTEEAPTNRHAITKEILKQCYEFLSAGTLGEDVCYSPFEANLSGTLLVTGFQSDKVWGKRFTPNNLVERSDVSGTSIGEFRLRVGFIHWPLPFVGVIDNEQFLKMSHSNELASYLEEKTYNRPIAIKFASDAGVPRHLYGKSKKAASVLFDEGPSALPLAMNWSLKRYNLNRSAIVKYSSCIDASLNRKPTTRFLDKYFSYYQENFDGINTFTIKGTFSDQNIERIEFHVFGRSIPITEVFFVFADEKYSVRFDPLGEIIDNWSVSPEKTAIFNDKFNDEILMIKNNIRDECGNKQKYCHLRLSFGENVLRPIFDSSIRLNEEINHYLGSFWKGEEGCEDG